MHMEPGFHHHHHDEEPKAFESVEQAVAVMSYMLEHNQHHAEELHELSHRLEAMGKSEASYLLDDALDKYASGNAMLAAALENLRKE